MADVATYEVDAFASHDLTGNRAGVVLGADGLRDGDMQAIARTLGHSETAFVLPAEADDHDVRVRFFTPRVEVPTCGHATVATHYLRARLRDDTAGAPVLGTVRQLTGAGVQSVDVGEVDGDFSVVMTQSAVEIREPIAEALADEVFAALGVEPSHRDHDCPVQFVSTGHGKLIVVLDDHSMIGELRPDMRMLTDLSAVVDAHGYFVFARGSEDDDVLIRARMFGPAMGIDEDPATGNGNGPAGACLVHHGLAGPPQGEFRFTSVQGPGNGRGGVIDVIIDVSDGEPMRVRVTGRAVLRGECRIAL